jgi:hypothetical protein
VNGRRPVLLLRRLGEATRPARRAHDLHSRHIEAEAKGLHLASQAPITRAHAFIKRQRELNT